MNSPLRAAVFLDRDGTLIEDPGYLGEPDMVKLFPGVPEALRRLKDAGFLTVIVTNQSGIGRGFYSEDDYHAVHRRLDELAGPGLIDAHYYCPDHPDQASHRRKPKPGMIFEAQRDLHVDLENSWMVGDRPSDLECGWAAGVRSLLVQTGLGAETEPDGNTTVVADFPAAADYILQHR